MVTADTRAAGHPRTAVEDVLPSAAVTRVVEETDAYSVSVQGVDIEAVRTGAGRGPSVVSAVRGDGFVATSVSSHFPMVTRATVPEEVVVATFVRSAPRGSLWCGTIELEPGLVITYGPGVEHTGVNPDGISFAFAVLERAMLEATADTLKVHLALPGPGEIRCLAQPTESMALGRKLSDVVEASVAGIPPEANREDDLAHSLIAAATSESATTLVRKTRRADSAKVFNTCVEYAEAVGRMPSIHELCLVSHVSERRLRYAFADVVDMPPTRFFGLWAMDRARKRLRGAEPAEASVTRVAMDLGFAHLGRFAGRYRTLYEESPSATLHSCR